MNNKSESEKWIKVKSTFLPMLSPVGVKSVRNFVPDDRPDVTVGKSPKDWNNEPIGKNGKIKIRQFNFKLLLLT